MGTCTKHQGHNHQHEAACGHVAITHAGHTDYLHDGHLHHMHLDHVDEHVLKSTRQIPNDVRRVMTAVDMTRLMYTVPAVDMSPFPTVITLTTWLTATCIIHMGITVMITGQSP